LTVEPISKWVSHYKPVVPAKAGIQKGLKILDSRLRGNDNKRPDDEKRDFETGSNQVFKKLIHRG
jgi:hypothetical protein